MPSAKSAARALAGAPSVGPLEQHRRRLGLAERAHGRTAKIDPILFGQVGRNAGADHDQPVEIGSRGRQQVEDRLRLALEFGRRGGPLDQGVETEGARLRTQNHAVTGEGNDGSGQFADGPGKGDSSKIGHGHVFREGWIGGLPAQDSRRNGREHTFRLRGLGLLRNAAITS